MIIAFVVGAALLGFSGGVLFHCWTAQRFGCVYGCHGKTPDV